MADCVTVPIPPLHPEATDDPAVIRWVTDTALLTDPVPQLSALVDEGVLGRVEIGSGEVRTWLGGNGSWAADGPRVRQALIDALSAIDPGALPDAELLALVENVIAREVAPIADSHGGGIRIASLQDGVLTVELLGACRGCVERERTVGTLVTAAVRRRFPSITEVRAAKPRTVLLPLLRNRGAGRR